MTPLQQCRALVKVCPKLFRIDHNGSVWWMREGYETATDPLHDLNAVHMAEDKCCPEPSNIADRYRITLDKVSDCPIHRATAKQRVEALL